nr:hypothetical protein [Bordetella petrii]
MFFSKWSTHPSSSRNSFGAVPMLSSDCMNKCHCLAAAGVNLMVDGKSRHAPASATMERSKVSGTFRISCCAPRCHNIRKFLRGARYATSPGETVMRCSSEMMSIAPFNERWTSANPSGTRGRTSTSAP